MKAEKPAWNLAIISGAVLRAMNWVSLTTSDYLKYLQNGQLPPARLTLTDLEVSLVLEGRV